MSENGAKSNERLFQAASKGEPYLVIAGEKISAFHAYKDAEAFAISQTSANSTSITIAQVLFKRDGTPFQIKAFPTTHAHDSFERARREFGL